MTIDVAGEDPNPLANLTNLLDRWGRCVIVSGDSFFSGSVQGRQMDFQASVIGECEDEGEIHPVTFTIFFVGRKP